MVHVFDGGKCVKAEVCVHFVSVVEERAVIVQSAAFVAVAPGDIRHALKSMLSELALVRVFARTEELGAYARKDLELGVGRSGSACRHFKAARGVLFVQLVEYRRRILRDLYVGVVLSHCERFHLQDYDVRMVEAVVLLLESSIQALLCLVLENALYELRRISFRLADASRDRCGEEAVCQAVVPVRVVEVSEERVYAA